MRRPGFTLPELLTVIVIVMLLAGILYPAMSQARHRAHETVCFLHQKDLAEGLMLYTDDFDGGLPVRESWPQALATDGIALCPELAFAGPGVGANLVLFRPGVPRNTASVPDSARVLAFADGKGYHPFVISEQLLAFQPLFYPGRRHRGGANAAFLDGHARWLAPATLAARDYRYWGVELGP